MTFFLNPLVIVRWFRCHTNRENTDLPTDRRLISISGSKKLSLPISFQYLLHQMSITNVDLPRQLLGQATKHICPVPATKDGILMDLS